MTVLFKTRKSIPLYMNDHARIASIYAWSLLTLFQSPRSSNPSKFKYLETFAKSFAMPVSIGRLAETLYADPNRAAFETYYKQHLKMNRVKPSTLRIYNRLPLALSRIPKDSPIKTQSKKDKFLYPKRPELSANFAQLTYNSNAKSGDEKFQLSSQYETLDKTHAILILPLGELEATDISALSGFKKITVMPQTTFDFETIKSKLKMSLGSKIDINLYEPTARHAAPYSPGNVYISGFCDKLSEQILGKALTNRAVNRFIPQVLRDDVMLMISDIIYRPVQTFYASLRSVEVHNAGCAVFYSGPATSLPRTIARSTHNPVYVMTHGTAVETDQDVAKNTSDIPDRKTVIKEIRRIFKYLTARTIKASPEITTSDSPHIYFATNSWSKSYEKASELITDKLSEIAPVSIFDYAAPIGLQKNIQASLIPCLHNALLSTRSSDIALLSQYINLPNMINPQKLALGQFPANEMNELIIKALEREMGAIIGNILLYNKISQKLSMASKAILVQCPGRFGNIRCLGRAFQNAGLPTLDVQALFVTEMARYRAPMADHMTVIDSFAEDLYSHQWDLPRQNISQIGSILLDEDIKHSKSGDAVKLRTQHLSGTQKHIITYASQPLPDREVMKAIEALATYMISQTDKHLCIKLHPAQDDVTQQKITNYLIETLSDSTKFTVLRELPFSKVMPFTNILISYFSNVCLMGPSHDIPVITLPTTVPIPAITLADMGLASHVENLAELGETIDKLIFEPPHKTYQDYISKNPHMSNLTSLDNLARIAEEMLKGMSHSEA